MEEFVTKEVCQIKHKEVEEMKDELKKLQDCIQNKFNKMYILLFSVLTTLILNLIAKLID